uniref:PH domain-containing protein n=1 Tax=Pygocentrus nattereri TaxID=42514 RepID=A0A3B4CGG8_PYGNA
MKFYEIDFTRDEPDGEIDVRRCVRVVEFEADKNYGLQIHTRDGEVTLSAMTSRIRRNWIDILQRHIRPNGLPDITLISNVDSSDLWTLFHFNFSNGLYLFFRHMNSDKDTSSSHPDQHNSGSEVMSPVQDEPDMMSSPSTNQREAGVGRDKDQEKRLEDRTKWFQEGLLDREGESPWDKVQLKKGTVASVTHMMPQISETLIGTDIEKKWEDFEKIPFGEMMLISSNGSQVLSLRQQVEALRKGRIGGGPIVPCGPDTPCASKLEQIEREHRERLQEMEREHERERREMEREKERLLKEEAQNAIQDVQIFRCVCAFRPESVSLQQELEGLSERYSQRCVELRRVQHTAGQKHTLIQEKEREVLQLRKENQDLQARLTEEMSLMRSFITGQKSGMLLRVKENEIEYLHKEIGCLRNEIQSLTKVTLDHVLFILL